MTCTIDYKPAKTLFNRSAFGARMAREPNLRRGGSESLILRIGKLDVAALSLNNGLGVFPARQLRGRAVTY